MNIYRFKVRQTFKVERDAVIEVQADTLEDAIEAVAEDAGADVYPKFADTRWQDTWDLQSEEVVGVIR